MRPNHEVRVSGALLLGIIMAAPVAASAPRPAGLSVPFVEHAGPPAGGFRYTTSADQASVAIEADALLRYGLRDRGAGAWAAVISERPVDACTMQPRGADLAPTRVTRLGAPSGDELDCRTYARVEIGEAWPGIELSVRTDGRRVEKLFTLAPGADAARIRMAVEGARRLAVSDRGELVVLAEGGSLGMSGPVAYQEIGGVRVPVEVAYAVDGTTYGFDLGPHDPAHPVVIDPFLQSTYVGGSLSENIDGMAIHPGSGDVYVVGFTTSDDLPGTTGGILPAYSRDGDGFVARLSADLTTLLQATYFADGRSAGSAWIVGVHPGNGDVYVVSSSRNLPPATTGGAQTSGAAYVSRLNPALTSVVQSSGLGLSPEFTPYRMAFFPGPAGDVLLAGRTDRPEAYSPLSGGAQGAHAGSYDGWILKLSADLTAFTGGTYLGGDGLDEIHGLGVNPVNGDVYVAGSTTSAGLPGVAGGYQPTFGGVSDAFVARLDPGLTSIVDATYFGGSGSENMTNNGGVPTGGLAFLSTGEVILMGEVQADGLPASATGAISSYQGLNGDDVFLARFDAGLGSVVRSTYWSPVGGAERGTDVAVVAGDAAILLAGWTQSDQRLPSALGAPQPDTGGLFDAFVSRISPDLKEIEISTYVGGAEYEDLRAMALHPVSGEIYVAGSTRSEPFPATTGGADASFGGGLGAGDGWVMRMTLDAPPCAGDCDGDGTVVGAELATVHDLVLGLPGTCAAADPDGSGTVTVIDMVMAIAAAVFGC